MNRYSARFLGELFYPMLSIVCTCSYAACAAYPAGVALDYFAKHGVRVGVAPSTGCESEDGRAFAAMLLCLLLFRRCLLLLLLLLPCVIFDAACNGEIQEKII